MVGQEFVVRRATRQDLPGILDCLREAFEPYRNLYTPAAFSDTVPSPEGLEERFRRMRIFVAVRPPREIIGTVACSEANTVGHIRGMAVLTGLHGGGVSHKLLEVIQEELYRWGCRRVTLDTTEPLQRAISFYIKNGFSATGTVHDFFGMPLYEYEKKL
jgi:N-acetylglutamate synthase-like GNAT family acetyltransferase